MAIGTLAKRNAREIIHEQAYVIDAGEDIPPDYATIDVNSVEDEDARTVGAEYVVYDLMIDYNTYQDGHFKIPHLWPGQNPPPLWGRFPATERV